MTRGAGWRWLERRLGRHLPPDRVAPILGDLAADHARLVARRGRLGAGVWLTGEALSLVMTYRRQPPGRRGPVDRIRTDVRHAWRAMRVRPAASLGTTTVLAFGIGLVSAMFALADPYVTRPLPFVDADRLVTVSVGTRETTDAPTVEGYRVRTDLFAGVAAFGSTETVTVAGRGAAVTLRLLPVSTVYFEVLGAAIPPLPEWRRLAESGETPVLLTHDASRRLGDAGRPGATIRVTGDTAALARGFRVGPTLPASFLFPSSSQSADGFMPLPDRAALVEVTRTPGGLTVAHVALQLLARLQPGVTIAQVEGALTTAPPGDMPIRPSRGVGVRAYGVAESMTGRLRPLGLAALGAGLLVLVVCAANVANLQLARGAYRRRELATREALGATAGDLGRLVMTEIGLLTLAGVAGGLGVTAAVLALTAGLTPPRYMPLGAPSVSLRVIGFAGLAGVVVMCAGLLPAAAAWRVRASALFNETSTAEPRRVRAARFAMTAAQTTVAVVLLVGAMLMTRSYVNLLAQDPGYVRDLYAVGVASRQSQPPGAWRPEAEATVERLRRLPGVSAAAVMKGTLVENIGFGFAAPAVYVDGQRVRGGLVKSVGTAFFQTAGTRLHEGRLLQPADEGQAAVVSASFARACCEGRSAIGRQVTWTERSVDRSARIVGVVNDVFDTALDRTPTPSAFVPISDRDLSASWTTYVVRSAGADPALATAIEREIHAVNPRVAVADGGIMRDRLMRSIQDRSFATLMVTFFGAAAIGVSAAGLVGVVGFVVARRTREIAIRMAIGAGRADVRRLVTREAARASAAGAGIGLLLGAWLSRTMESFLYGIAPADPWSLVLAAGLLVLVVALAAWVPARRAIRLSPSEALRIE